MQVKRNILVPQELSSQNAKNLRTFLLVQQLAAQEIGQRIAQARKEAGLTQEELADLVDVSKRSLQGYEAGDVIPYKHFRTIAEVVNRPVGWFLHGEATPVEGAEGADEMVVASRLAALESRQATLEGLAQEILSLVRGDPDAKVRPVP